MPNILTQLESRRRLQIALLLLAMACLPALPQTGPSVPSAAPPTATGLYRIAGTVVNAVTGEPVRRATVAALAEADSHTVASAVTDIDGSFALEGLPAAKYQLSASRRGFRTAFYDEHDEFSTAIVTGPGQDTASLAFRLTPGSVLRGVVTGDGGDPVKDAEMMLFLKPHTHNPSDRIKQVESTTTDDTGAYEFGDLAAGEYLLAVKAKPWYALHRPVSESRPRPANDPSATLDVAYPVTFFDSTTDEAAASVIVLAGGNREEANIALHAVPALHLTIEMPRRPDGSLASAELRQSIFGAQVSTERTGYSDSVRTGTAEFNELRRGTAEFTGVAPGHYELAQGDPPRIVDLDATASQQVDFALGTPTVAVSGTLQMPSGSLLTEEANVVLDSRDPAHRQSPIQTTCTRGSFNFASVPPGAWELSAAGSGSPLPIASITTGSRTRVGNQVTVRDHPLSLAVTVSLGETRVEGFASESGASGAPGDRSSSLGWHGVAGVMVVLAPKNKSSWPGLIRRDQSDSDGSFSLRDVVPGQYTVVAIEDGWALDWAQPEVLSRYLPGGIAVTVTEQSGKTLTLSRPVPVQTR
jgi:hypothetical protein